jgi:hypothetical protein
METGSGPKESQGGTFIQPENVARTGVVLLLQTSVPLHLSVEGWIHQRRLL